MVRSCSEKVRWEVTGAFALMLALLVLLLPLRWLSAALAAALVHELCHGAAVLLCGGRILTVCVDVWGARIETSPMGEGRVLLCALAGPLGALLLLPAAKWIPRVAICALFQSAYNLLPVYPLDGGKALRSGAYLLLPPQKAERCCRWIRRGCCVLLVGAAFAAVQRGLGLPAVLAAIGWLCRPLGRNGLRNLKKTLQTGATRGTIEEI